MVGRGRAANAAPLEASTPESSSRRMRLAGSNDTAVTSSHRRDRDDCYDPFTACDATGGSWHMSHPAPRGRKPRENLAFCGRRRCGGRGHRACTGPAHGSSRPRRGSARERAPDDPATGTLPGAARVRRTPARRPGRLRSRNGGRRRVRSLARSAQRDVRAAKRLRRRATPGAPGSAVARQMPSLRKVRKSRAFMMKSPVRCARRSRRGSRAA